MCCTSWASVTARVRASFGSDIATAPNASGELELTWPCAGLASGITADTTAATSAATVGWRSRSSSQAPAKAGRHRSRSGAVTMCGTAGMRNGSTSSTTMPVISPAAGSTGRRGRHPAAASPRPGGMVTCPDPERTSVPAGVIRTVAVLASAASAIPSEGSTTCPSLTGTVISAGSPARIAAAAATLPSQLGDAPGVRDPPRPASVARYAQAPTEGYRTTALTAPGFLCCARARMSYAAGACSPMPRSSNACLLYWDRRSSPISSVPPLDSASNAVAGNR